MELGFLVNKLETKNRSLSADARKEKEVFEDEVYELKNQLESQRTNARLLFKRNTPQDMMALVKLEMETLKYVEGKFRKRSISNRPPKIAL